MTARQTITAGLSRLRRQPGRRERRRERPAGAGTEEPAAALLRWTEAAIHLLLGAALSGAVLFGRCAPFGVALVGAAGAGVCGGAALLGACFGYLTVLEFTVGLRYASAAILTFAAAFAFWDWKPARGPWFMPLAAGLMDAFAGFVVLSRSGWRARDAAELAVETALTVCACWCYRAVLLPLRGRRADRALTPERKAALLVLLCTVLVALDGAALYREITLGGVLAAACTALGAWLWGCAPGGALGVATGAAVDLARGGLPLHALELGLAGLTAGLCRGKRRWAAAAVFAATGAAAVLWLWGDDFPVAAVSQAALGALGFLLLPGQAVVRLRAWTAWGDRAGPDRGARQAARRRLDATSRAFRALHDALRLSLRPPDNDNDLSCVFDRAALRVCRRCSMRDKCWKDDYSTTFNAMNDATPAMARRGRAAAEDFPGWFAGRCIRFPELLSAVNEELAALFCRRQYNARIRESRAAVCGQYAQLSELLGAAAAELAGELAPDTVGDRRLRAWTAQLGLDVRTWVFRNGRGLLQVEAEGPGCSALAREGRLAELGRLLGQPLRVERQEEGSLTLLQEEPLMAVAGIAARKKDGETVSGDAGSWFKRADGKLYVLLCDGMGSGPEANRESSLAVRLLEQFLRAGVEAGQALATLSSALALRGEDTGGFTTVDLLQVDLFTGEGELFKLGAAPTYVRRGDRVGRLAGSSLPAGLGEGGKDALDRFPLTLSPGDVVLMVSDGVCAAEDDGWLRERLAAFDGRSPRDLARRLITEGPPQAADDRTALVIRLDRRTL